MCTCISNTIMIALTKKWHDSLGSNSFNFEWNKAQFALQMVTTKCSHFGHIINERDHLGQNIENFHLKK